MGNEEMTVADDKREETADSALLEAKRSLRRSMQETLRGLEPRAIRHASVEACDRLMALEEVREAGLVLGFMSMAAEIDPSRAMQECLDDGISVAVPVVDEESRELDMVEIESLDTRAFRRDRFGILTPIAGRRVRASEVDAIIAPGLAFDRRGGRLGRGAGYYDRLLIRVPEHCTVIGFALSVQIVPSVPTGSLDRRVHRIVTDRESLAAVAPERS
jgi:5-formyltetrahydrofolate cyclo-ligase